MGTPMISQIFRRGVYHLSCDRAPIVGREISPAPLDVRARASMWPALTLKRVPTRLVRETGRAEMILRLCFLVIE